MGASGNLLPEPQGHGLTATPPTQDIDSFADIPVETYSNNIGYYNQIFAITLPEAQDSAPLPASDETTLAIKALEIEKDDLSVNERTTIRIAHQASGQHLNGVTVQLYEGNPNDNGTLLDIDHIPRMRYDQAHVVAMPYTPVHCGPRTLYVHSFAHTGGFDDRAQLTIDVPCGPTAIRNLSGPARFSPGDKNEHQGGHSKHADKVSIQGKFALNRTVDLPVLDLASDLARINLNSVLRTRSDRELVSGVPLVLIASQGNNRNNAWYQSDQGARPRLRLHIKASPKKPGLYSFDLNIDKADLDVPQHCQRIALTTGFTLFDGSGIPQAVEQKARWSCNQHKRTLSTQ